MQILECDAKKLLSRHAIAIPDGIVAATPAEAETAAMRLGPEPVYIKAQIRAGDRLAAGGVRSAASHAEARDAARALLDRKLATAQTGPGGHTVSKVLVERAVTATRALYVAIGLDAAAAAITVTVAECGRDGRPPDAAGLRLLRLALAGERREGDLLAFCQDLGFAADDAVHLREILLRLHRAFIALDASLIEINPLVLTPGGAWVALDAKLTTDDNALFRHAEFAALDGESDEIALQAQRHQINFMQMDGDVGVVCNGAGLGLATLDMVRAAGGAPANFMDVRTTAKSLDIAHGVKLVLENPRARVLLVNVYGGGMQPCDTIVEGLGIAYRKNPRMLPIVLRITGNNEDLARLRLANFKLPSIECRDMWQAVTRAVAMAQGRAQ